MTLEAWWADLEKGEPEASRALLNLAERPEEALAFLKGNLKPVKIDADQVRAILARLGDNREEVWMAAFGELEYFDPRLAIELPTLMAEVIDSPARQRMVEVMSGHSAGWLKGKPVDLRSIDRGREFNFFSQPVGSWWAEHLVSRLNSTPWGTPKKKWTQAVRAIVLLEHLGTPDAVTILKDMAAGHPDAQPTKVAREALEGMERE